METEYIQIRDIQQFVMIAEGNTKHVIIYIHGGPGFSSIPLWEYMSDISHLATFVLFDQRGTGKTYWKNKSKTASIDEIVLDLKELIEQMKTRYEVNQVVLMGHSWGTIVGEEYIHLYPEDVSAYIGVGQVISFPEGVQASLDKAKQVSLENNDQKSYQKLSELRMTSKTIVKDFPKVIKVLDKYGYAMNSKETFKKLQKSQLWDIRYLISSLISGYQNKLLLEYLKDYDLKSKNRSYTMPYFYILGENDFQVPTPLAQEYMESISADCKACYTLKKSNHAPMLDEPEKFKEILQEIFERIAYIEST